MKHRGALNFLFDGDVRWGSVRYGGGAKELFVCFVLFCFGFFFFAKVGSKELKFLRTCELKFDPNLRWRAEFSWNFSEISLAGAKICNFCSKWRSKELNDAVTGGLTLKEPGFLDPSHSRGGQIPPPPKISETDWRNIKCVVLVDSYDPPESIGTKKVQTYLVWRHSDVISDVMSKTRKSPKIAKIMVFRYFSSKSCIFGNDVCQSMLTHVLTPNKPNK